MKIQYIAVIFVVIIIPISLVMSQYLQTQIKTITLQTAYAKNLDDATHGAMKAFQINSINNKYSSVSDSKIRDIEASIKTFYNLLGTSMDSYIASEEQLSGFVPAILFTLYDGYYIYSLYENKYQEEIAEVGDPDNPNDDKIQVKIPSEGKYEDGLHPYIYYSAKYKLTDGEIIVVNYTLDNEITVYGNLKDEDGTERYLTKSGYLIDPGKVSDINKNSTTLKYDGIEIGPEEIKEHLITIDETGVVTEQDYNYVIYNNQKVYQDRDSNGNIKYDNIQVENYDGNNFIGYITLKNVPKLFWYDEYKKKPLQSEAANVYKEYFDIDLSKMAKDTTYYASAKSKMESFKSTSAFKYYYDAYNFSRWLLTTKLANVTQDNLISMSSGINTIKEEGLNEYLSVNTGDKKIFDTTVAENDPMLSSSIFNSHREAVIRKSIETNLTTAIANYTKSNSLSTYEFRLPKIGEENWYQLTNNISIITFMQGVPIGMKYFNNYSVITSTKNEEVINAQTVYIVAQEGDTREYHQLGCKELIESVNNNASIKLEAYNNLSFQRQTAQVSDTDKKYFYPQTRIKTTIPLTKIPITGCYNCIVNASADYDIDNVVKGQVTKNDGSAETYSLDELKGVRTIYLRALARERYDLYKTNFDLSN